MELPSIENKSLKFYANWVKHFGATCNVRHVDDGRTDGQTTVMTMMMVYDNTLNGCINK